MELEKILGENREKKTIAQLRQKRKRKLEEDEGCDFPYSVIGLLGGGLALVVGTTVGGILSYCYNHPSYADGGLLAGVYAGGIALLAGMVGDLTGSD